MGLRRWVGVLAAFVLAAADGSARARDWAACRAAPEPNCLFEEAARQAFRIDDPADQVFALLAVSQTVLPVGMAPAAAAFAEAAVVAAEAVSEPSVRGFLLRLLAAHFARLGAWDRAERLADRIDDDAERDAARMAVGEEALARGEVERAVAVARRIWSPVQRAVLLAVAAAAPASGEDWRSFAVEALATADIAQDPVLWWTLADVFLQRATAEEALAVFARVEDPALRARLHMRAAMAGREQSDGRSAAVPVALALVDLHAVPDPAARDELLGRIAELRTLHGDVEGGLELAARIVDPLLKGAALARMVAATGAAAATESAATQLAALEAGREVFRDPDVVPRFHAVRAELAWALEKREAALRAWQDAAEAALFRADGAIDAIEGQSALLALARRAPDRAEAVLLRLSPGTRALPTLLPVLLALSERGTFSPALRRLLAELPPGPARWQAETELALALGERGDASGAVAVLDAMVDPAARASGLARLALRLAQSPVRQP